jgi:hypothetical protein
MNKRYLASMVRSVVWMVLGVAYTSEVSAHGLGANQIQIVLHDQVAEVLATPPVEYVSYADTNHDGRLEVREVQAQRETIRRTFLDGLALTNENNIRATVERADISVPRGDDPDGTRGSDFVRLTVVFRWNTSPNSLRLRCAFVTTHPISVFASRAAHVDTTGVLTLQGQGQQALLSNQSLEIVLLQSNVQPTSDGVRYTTKQSLRTMKTYGVLSVCALVFLGILWRGLGERRGKN